MEAPARLAGRRLDPEQPLGIDGVRSDCTFQLNPRQQHHATLRQYESLLSTPVTAQASLPSVGQDVGLLMVGACRHISQGP